METGKPITRTVRESVISDAEDDALDASQHPSQAPAAEQRSTEPVHEAGEAVSEYPAILASAKDQA